MKHLRSSYFVCEICAIHTRVLSVERNPIASIEVSTKYIHRTIKYYTVLAENHSPTVLNPNVVLEVSLGQTYTSLMIVQVQDSDGDRVSFSLSSDSPPGLAIGASSGILSWASVPDMSLPTTRKTAKVVITDGKVDVLWVPNIKFCKCQVRTFW